MTGEVCAAVGGGVCSNKMGCVFVCVGGGAFEHIFSFCFYSNMQLYVKSNILSMTIQTLSKWAQCDL